MKTKVQKKSFWGSVLSLGVLLAFAYMAIASFGTSQQKRKLPDGRWEIAKHFSDGTTEAIVGNVDDRGLFEGPVKITYEDDNYIVTHTEEVEMRAGVRHGISSVTYPSGTSRNYCYQHGTRVEMENCTHPDEKSASNHSIYEHFRYELPWFEFKLDACGYDSLYMQAFLDTLEQVLFALEFDPMDFEDSYDDVISALEDTPWDSIIVMNSELSLYNGFDLISLHEFRLATIDAYMKSDSNTYKAIAATYPNYLLMLNERAVTDEDFEAFCAEYDSIMASFEPVALADTFYLDSLDTRIFRTLDIMTTQEEEAAKGARSLIPSNEIATPEDLLKLGREVVPILRSRAVANTPAEVAEAVMLSILESFIKGDFIRNTTRAVYMAAQNIVNLANVVTIFYDYPTPSSVILKGNVTNNGGGDVSERGMAWGQVYNPTVHNQVMKSGTGSGEFEVTLSGLTEGTTYYARAYAVNSAGTSYGNCITFVPTSTIGTESVGPSPETFAIYPNPAKDRIFLSLPAGLGNGEVLGIYDLSGKLVKEMLLEHPTSTTLSMNIAPLPQGIYTCMVMGDGRILARQKLVIRR